ncbi:hypothetical protein E1264_18410 [Actinomadura sp. KC216]|uniref:hypothetical protein n=1 Tax=Actinomadura sp. KC216 TaxID=2530370 RepID=UPI00104BE0DE|nr:hypothetical protein [Actinomadura sp. KC216]TDB86269.1 hypothetical protein E1264_18410 [Actinomadura sp. KC216]
MLLTMPSGLALLAPITTPTTWNELGPAAAGTAVTASTLERNISSAVAYHRRPAMFQGVGSGAQSIPTTTWTSINLAEVIDLHAGHSDDANPSRVLADFTASFDDWYLCTGMVPLAASVAGRVGIAGLLVNGTTRFEGGKLALGISHATTMMVCDLVHLEALDYLQLQVWQNSGGAVLTENTTTKKSQLTLRWATSAAGDTVATPSVPRTWTADDLLTADSAGAGQVPLNTHVRDVIRWLRFPPAARLDSQGTAQTIPSGSGSWTSVNMTSEQLDNYGGHDNGVNPSRYVCQRAGLYFVHGVSSLADPLGAAGYRASRLAVNGTRFYGGTSTIPATGTTAGSATAVSAHIRLRVGDYVELQAQQTHGSALAVSSGAASASRLVVLWRGL